MDNESIRKYEKVVSRRLSGNIECKYYKIVFNIIQC